ncbi:MAG: FAD-dependent oxidoreductase [Tepidisphaerales bacterium]
MSNALSIQADVVIVGGGVAGLWLLDELTRNGYAAILLEKNALGAGQTVASQGIIHGGLKYMFDGILTAPAKAIAEMPPLWRAALAGHSQPDLSGTTVLSDCCHIWGTGSLKSRLFVKGSALALRAAPDAVDRAQAPAPLATIPGTLLRVPEQVLDPASLLVTFARRNAGRIVQFAGDLDLSQAGGPGNLVQLVSPPKSSDTLRIRFGRLVLTAGEGNAELRQRLGLPGSAMQRRPLHMVLLRGRLPQLFGHCVGGPKPRLTITSAPLAGGRTAWQVGGLIAEDGVKMSPAQLKVQTVQELRACLPGLDLAGVQFSAYRIDRAEAANASGQRPDDIQILQDGNVLTAWPTKLALAPRLAERTLQLLPKPSGQPLPKLDWPAPPVALPPWESATNWEPLI